MCTNGINIKRNNLLNDFESEKKEMLNNSPKICGYTAKNTVISPTPNFLVWRFCGKAQMQKLCLSTKFSHQEIR